ncbi:MAG: hypothetical protein PW792_11550 [Acidobacteriaceae bacterium]|nr:hypothetical protein [Acidobacteriaceae bacterium]
MSLVLEFHESATHHQEKASGAVAGRRSVPPAVIYCLLVVLLPILAIPAFIALGRSDFFIHHGASVWVQSNDSVFAMRNRQCDVLVYGDSTAMTGIDPELVENNTGFHVCNISVTNAVLAVTGNLTLDHYLQQNGRPKVLVVQLSPDDFQQGNRVWQHTIYAEGLLELLRHGSPAEARQVLISHPHESIAFAGYAAGFSAYYAIKDVWFRVSHIRSEEDAVQVRNGFFTPPSPARKYCTPMDTSVDGDGGNFARSLADDYRKRYSAQSAVVLVDVAPIPSCDGNLKAFSSELHGITSNNLQALPIGLFNDGRHYTARGSQVVSTLLSRQINQVALQNPAIDDRTPPSLPPMLEAQLRSVSLNQ